MLGYPHKLYVLPFDHRSSFIKAFLGQPKTLDKKQIKLIKQYKQIIFEAFLLSLKYVNEPKECAILVDEAFGGEIIKYARKKKITLCLPVEKSGQREFKFEHGRNFVRAIEQIKPQIVKALVRYNPANKKINLDQLKRLNKLSDYCHQNDYKFMLELLVPPTDSNLRRVKGKKENYDLKIRPTLTLKAIQEFHQAGVEPDIWKIEAMENQTDWAEVIDLVRDNGHDEVAIIMLGRGESFAKVKQWMNLAPRHLLNGFAVGRTVFMRPLLDLHQQTIGRPWAVKQIAKNYLELIRYWER